MGHSLGAGLAVLLSVLLRPLYPQLHCYAYSPPGGLLDRDLAAKTEDWVTSVRVFVHASLAVLGPRVLMCVGGSLVLRSCPTADTPTRRLMLCVCVSVVCACGVCLRCVPVVYAYGVCLWCVPLLVSFLCPFLPTPFLIPPSAPSWPRQVVLGRDLASRLSLYSLYRLRDQVLPSRHWLAPCSLLLTYRASLPASAPYARTFSAADAVLQIVALMSRARTSKFNILRKVGREGAGGIFPSPVYVSGGGERWERRLYICMGFERKKSATLLGGAGRRTLTLHPARCNPPLPFP